MIEKQMHLGKSKNAPKDLILFVDGPLFMPNKKFYNPMDSIYIPFVLKVHVHTSKLRAMTMIEC